MDVKGFDWDEGNTGKNWTRHRVSDGECEQVFFGPRLLVCHDKWQSGEENRYYGLGSTFAKRKFFIAYTLREEKIRIISARDMIKKERREHENKHEKKEEGASLQE